MSCSSATPHVRHVAINHGSSVLYCSLNEPRTYAHVANYFGNRKEQFASGGIGVIKGSVQNDLGATFHDTMPSGIEFTHFQC